MREMHCENICFKLTVPAPVWDFRPPRHIYESISSLIFFHHVKSALMCCYAKDTMNKCQSNHLMAMKTLNVRFFASDFFPLPFPPPNRYQLSTPHTDQACWQRRLRKAKMGMSFLNYTVTLSDRGRDVLPWQRQACVALVRYLTVAYIIVFQVFDEKGTCELWLSLEILFALSLIHKYSTIMSDSWFCTCTIDCVKQWPGSLSLCKWDQLELIFM